ncbi:MAG TPA: MFS transporter [Candidatus Limadaptatus stercorigallinarum]|uniref:MFS transporter n=1 Tax=Candidatus Limadaptatus stercorigallinarum TaxID=2840845 RepID=A0A9D1HT80_9FIRM|nr:MFS transporter [Candidatus Limadaptatus stercorigallinarum]
MKEKVAKLFSTVKAMWDKPLEGRYLNIKEILSFGLYSLGNSWIYNTIMLVVTITEIPYFYDIDAIHGYLIYIAGSLINMLLLPIVGQSMEKKRTKWGRYKPYILFSLPILALFTMMSMWVPQYNTEVDRIIYAYCSCVPVIAISTFANNMYQTMPNVITPNTQERADIMTPIGLIVGFAPTIMNVIIGPIRSAFPTNEEVALRIVGAIAVVLGTVFVIFIVKVKERVYELNDQNRELLEAQAEGVSAEDIEDERFVAAAEGAEAVAEEAEADLIIETGQATGLAAVRERFKAKAAERRARKAAEKASPDYLSFADSMKLLFKNKALWILFAALVIGSLREFWMQFQNLIIQTRFDEIPSVAVAVGGVPKTVIGFGVTVSMLLLPLCTRKLSKNWIIILFSSLSLLSIAILGFVGFGNIPQGTTSAVVITILLFIARVNPTYLLIPVMLGDLADYQQYKTGRRLEGHIQNFIMVIPVMLSFVFMLCGWVWQQDIGFEPSAYKGNIDIPYTADLLNTASEWFTAAFLLTAASILGMIIILIFYPLSKKKVEEVTVALSGASVNADEMGKGDLNFVAEMRGTASSVDGTPSDGENTDEDTADDGASSDDGEDGGGDSPTAIE